ncbi:hypothetical protein SAMN05428642_103515 [Flaviramulus basaltis]|uniref:Glycosyl transferases group 1 n=1 Tax=Flaviramulus basaltis TaxID=369401 RepID=A0A1K2INR4_9FLAO|nr:hypothetical protein [Flaviramulus basaltis]SFZ94015.1 hypothetical protein SAMN05428642_103515 [Flaviramulus basaltis]
MKVNKITFFFPELSKVNQTLDVENPEFWKTDASYTNIITYKAWLYYTYVQLKKLNYQVAISDTLPLDGIIVILADKKSRDTLNTNYKNLSKDAFLIVIRADELEFRFLLADIEIVQNGKYANNKNCFFIPHWPHPGIVPRKKERGTKIKNIVYKGGRGNLDQMFSSQKWLDFLNENNLNFVLDTEENNIETYHWHDYSDADIIVAVRPSFDNHDRSDKPALKLVNCWFAGVPAILGKEYAFYEQRKSELDYMQAETLDEVISEIKALIEKPEIYQQMVDNGTVRSKAFTPENITKIWSSILMDEVPKVKKSVSYKVLNVRNKNIKKFLSLFFINHTYFEWRQRLRYVIKKQS